MSRLPLILATAIAPCLWGCTYVVFTQTLPVEHPLLVGALRALPAGLLLCLLGPGLPPRAMLPRLLVLGLANIGLFFALLFVAAARLPGGVAATLMSAQPLIVALLAWPALGRRPRPLQLVAALAGMLGVALLVLDPTAKPDLIGILAALAAAGSMAAGTVLIQRWGRLGSPLGLAAWQLALGGLVLLPVALVAEGAPPAPDGLMLAGLSCLVLLGTALPYWLWVRGVSRLGVEATFLSLASPVVATLLGVSLAGEQLTGLQLLGMAVILLSTLAGMVLRPSSAQPGSSRPTPSMPRSRP